MDPLRLVVLHTIVIGMCCGVALVALAVHQRRSARKPNRSQYGGLK